MMYHLKTPKNNLIKLLRPGLLIALGSFLVLCIPKPADSSQSDFSVYCTSNFDSTGECTDEDNNNLACTLIAGNLIECINSQNKIFECIQFGAIIAYQTPFSCAPKKQDDKSTNFTKYIDQPGQTPENSFDSDQQKPSSPIKKDNGSTTTETISDKPSTPESAQENTAETSDDKDSFNPSFSEAF